MCQLINFAVFLNIGPSFKATLFCLKFQYYSMWVSLIGTFLCVAVMFLMDWVTALITFAIVGILYFYINYRKPGNILKYLELKISKI